MTRRLSSRNTVRGHPAWIYGLFVTGYREPPNDHLPVVAFEIRNIETGQEIPELRASGYRTTTLARSMGERELQGYEHVAREAIKAA